MAFLYPSIHKLHRHLYQHTKQDTCQSSTDSTREKDRHALISSRADQSHIKPVLAKVPKLLTYR